MEGVPHLNELNARFREQGFEIVAASDEEEGAIAGFVKSRKLAYGVVKASKAAVYGAYGANGYPSAWVLDTEGKVIWSGHPATLKDTQVEKWIKDLAPGKITRKLAEPLKDAVAAYNAGDFGKAANEVAKHANSDDATVKADAAQIQAALDKRRALGEARIKKAREAGDLVKLAEMLGAEAKAFDGSDFGKQCAEESAKVKADKNYENCAKAKAALDKLKPKINDMLESKAKKALERIARDFPDTPAGKEAAELAKDFE